MQSNAFERSEYEQRATEGMLEGGTLQWLLEGTISTKHGSDS